MTNNEEKRDTLKVSDLTDPEFPDRQEVVGNMAKSIAVFLQRPEIPAYIEGFRNVINRIIPPAIKFFSEFGELILKMQEADKLRAEHYPRIVENLNFLAEKTWFVSMSLALSDYEGLAFSPERIGRSEESEKELDDHFISVYGENFEYLVSVILEQFPSRAFAISPAIGAHNRGEYALSIPVFLSQADGILLDITSAELFTSRGHISKHAQKQMNTTAHESWHEYFDDAAWSPLSVVRPVGWGLRERLEAEYSGFNRHTVMHGLDLNYATEINSFKSFSILSYIVSLKDNDQ